MIGYSEISCGKDTMNFHRLSFGAAFAGVVCVALAVVGAEPAATQPGTTRPGTIGVLDYLKSISGKRTVAGLHNREPNSRPATQTDRLFGVVGRYPGLWSGDFLYSAGDVNSRWTMVKECKKQWDEGSIVQLMLHVAPPTQPEVCGWNGGVLSHLSDPQWVDLLVDGGTLNKVWKSRLDGYAVYCNT